MRSSSIRRAAAEDRFDVFSALSGPTRRKLLDLLAHGERPVKRLASFFPTTRSAVSQQLRVLQAAGLVSVRRVGREHLFRLRPGRLREVYDWVSRYERFWRS